MAFAVPLFYGPVVFYLTVVIAIVTLVVEVAAFLHCLLQRSEAFAAIGTFSKGIWLAMTGGSILFVLLNLGAAFGVLSGMLVMITVVIALVYLLDIRPALRDVTDGRGPW